MFGKQYNVHRASVFTPLALTLICLLLILAACGNNSNTTTTASAPTVAPTTAPQATADTGNGNGYGKYGNGGGKATPAPTTAITGPTQSVTITGAAGSFGFSPATITIAVGTTVIWTNNTGAPHTVTSDDTTSFTSGGTFIAAGKTFGFKFTKAGTYAYHCEVHPSMKATIIVQ